jgi:NAD-dependent deacetylase
MNVAMNPIVVFTGAGMSAESGISTFRDSGGLWEKYKIEDVATPEAFARNPQLVLDFYNQRRRQIREAAPNDAHYALAALEDRYDVIIITQNIDDLHERAGSSRVIHLHGEIMMARSSINPSLKSKLDCQDISLGDLAADGSQLRPHIVWFGEEVPLLEEAIQQTRKAGTFLVVGTSLNVYPAAGLVHHAPKSAQRYLVDPNIPDTGLMNGFEFLREKAGVGVPRLVARWMEIK